MIKKLLTKDFAFIIFGLVLTVYSSDTAHADSRWQHSNRTEDYFRQAMTSWHQNSDNYQNADCKPSDVRFKYYDFGRGHENEIASVDYIWAGYKENLWREVHFNPIAFMNSYCKININTMINRETRPRACITMIHEYGHLIGYEHVRNWRSAMYSSWDGLTGQRRIDLESRNIKHRLARSICPQIYRHT